MIYENYDDPSKVEKNIIWSECHDYQKRIDKLIDFVKGHHSGTRHSKYKALEKHFKSNFNSDHSRMIKERYSNILSNSNPKEMINNHYNGLFGSHGGNVI